MSDKFELSRFKNKQKAAIEQVLFELKAGKKRTHWIWYIFPQLKILGFSDTAKYYGISSIEEARAYLLVQDLSVNYYICLEALLSHNSIPIANILGKVDAMKLKSSLTLFEIATEDDKLLILIKHALFTNFSDERCLRTLEFLDDG